MTRREYKRIFVSIDCRMTFLEYPKQYHSISIHYTKCQR